MLYRVQLKCDNCGTMANSEPGEEFGKVQDPPGWIHFGIIRPDGTVANDWCPACSRMSLLDLIRTRETVNG